MGSRQQTAAPLLAALAATATVVLITLVSGSGGVPGPELPAPVPPDISVQDRAVLSLDRCSDALLVAGLAGRYPDRRDWRPLAELSRNGVVVTMLDAPVPFVCATGPTTVDVSEPRVAVPVGASSLLLSTPSGVLAAAAPEGGVVAVTAAGEPPGAAAARYFLGLAPAPVTDAAQLTVAIGDAGGVGPAGPPSRLALPALHVVDRRSVPFDRSREAAALLRRCRGAAVPARAGLPWVPAQVADLGRGLQVLVTAGRTAVGGCTITAQDTSPLQVWRIGPDSDGPRPFVWLPSPGAALPDIGPDVAAGPVQAVVTRMEIAAATGRRWQAVVGGGTFVTRIPDGIPPDPRALTVRAFDADGELVYEGPAAG